MKTLNEKELKEINGGNAWDSIKNLVMDSDVDGLILVNVMELHLKLMIINK